MTLILEGSTLGAKHKNLNAIASATQEKYSFDKVEPRDGDVVNLIKIDIASKNKNVDYILNALVCEDLLYVSRAIKQSLWLVTNADYRHIINPEYLHQTLYPRMMVQSVKKFNKFIMMNLKDCRRVEEFYKYEDEPKKAVEWLPHCSVDFINANVIKHAEHIDIKLVKRLCEKSFTVLQALSACNSYNSMHKVLPVTMFLLKHNTDKYLDIVEKQHDYCFPKFNKITTELLMKQARDRVIKNFKDYCNHIHIQTFLKHLKKENIKDFLMNLFKEKEMNPRRVHFNFDVLTTIIASMPEDDRLEFITQILINRIYDDDKYKIPIPLKTTMQNVYEFTCQFNYIFTYRHYWYRYAPFNVAFTKIQEIMNNQTSNNELCSMFNTLIKASIGSTENLQTLIAYYRKNYINADKSVKYSFIKDLLSLNNFHNFEKDMWAILEKTFMDDLLNNEINDRVCSNECYSNACVEAFIIYYTLHKSKVPKEIEDKFHFSSMKSYQAKLNKNEQDILFTYLYNTIIRKLNSQSSSTKEEFTEKANFLDNALNLLVDWEKDLVNYPAVINAIRDLININEENKFGESFTFVYNKKKSWKKIMFNEALKINPSEEALINVLKHDPKFLETFENKVDNMYFNNNITLKQYHKKVKIYWSESLWKQLVQKYLDQLNNTEHNKAVIRALCILLTKEDLQNVLIKYAPVDEKIDWNDINESTLIIRQNFAKNMHIARPQPSPESILNYCKGDYYPFALPSLYSIFYNLNGEKSQKFISSLLDSKPALQKHGVRLAFIKLSKEEVKNILGKVLAENKNVSVRQIAFKLTYNLLCKEKDDEKAKAIWNILDSFLDNMTDKENEAIYELLLKVRDVPVAVAPLYYMKSYNILKNASKDAYEKNKYTFENTFVSYARELMDRLNPEFVIQMLSHFVDADFIKGDYVQSKLEVLSSFLLYSDNEETQMRKYNSIMVPFLKKCFENWEYKTNNCFTVKLNFDKLLNILQNDIKYHIYEKKQIIPIRLYETIYSELEKNLDYTSNYMLLTKWQLTVAFVRHLKKYNGTDWNEGCEIIASDFSKECTTYLKNHCEKLFSNIYVLFARALDSCFKSFFTDRLELIANMLKTMLHDENHVQVFLCVLKLLQHIFIHMNSDATRKYVEELFKIISEHQSPEVQIHYYHCRNVHLKSVSDAIMRDKLNEIHMADKEPIS